MKKFLSLLVGFIFLTTVTKAQYVVIPDNAFRNFLLGKYPSCFDDGTGRLNTTCSAVATEDTLIISNLNIRDLTGIESFTSLKYLDCSHNFIDVVPSLPHSLKYLNCSFALLPSVPPFTTLPVFPPDLTYLDCSNNETVSNLVVPGSVTYLNCSNDGLYNLPVLPNTLTYLDCSGQVDATLEPDPVVLHSLPALLPGSLKFLNCSGNAISVLPTLPKSLTSLVCTNMHSGNTGDVKPLIPTLFCLPVLPASLDSLECDTNIRCVPNLVPGLQTNLPLCNPTNNENNCQSFPVMNGNIFYDNNSNGIKDPTELYMPYIPLRLSDGDYTYSNSDGYYQIAATVYLGSYALFAYAPRYYKAVPIIMTYNFETLDTLVTQDVAMQPTAIVDSLNLSVYSYHRFARPGSDFPVVVNYANVGTTTISPTVTFNYDNTLLTYDSSSDHNVVNNGSSLSLSESGFVPGQSNSFIAYFTAKTTDVLGDSLNAKVTITANATSAEDSINTVINSSLDPNDKEATPQLTPQQVVQGKAIKYTIRFQNTGTDTAFNIVIADTLSSLLQDSTLQMISSSSPCKVTVTGNVVFFEFLNVQLPDNKINDIGSNGYVSFSVQPQTSVSSGSIANTASIYFDYNTPVVTNTATTLIQDPNIVVPVKLLSFTALKQVGNTSTVLLYWSTTSEINTKSFIVEQSTDGINFNDIATVSAKGFGSHSYSYSVDQNTSVVYYRLKMIDDNGQYTCSKIISISNQSTESFIVLTNPAKDKVSVQTFAPSLTNTNAEIINSEGAVVKTFVLQQGVQTIDVSNLADGSYYIRSGLGTRKVVISR